MQLDIHDKKEVAKLNMLVNLLGKRIIPCYLFSKSNRLFTKWQFNACLQTSIIINYILKEALPEYKITSWEGQFQDSIDGDYNHAWLYCEHESDSKRNILIDTARVSKNTIFEIGAENEPIMYLDSKLSSTVEFSRKEIIINEDDNEYYTQLNINEILVEVSTILVNSFKFQ